MDKIRIILPRFSFIILLILPLLAIRVISSSDFFQTISIFVQNNLGFYLISLLAIKAFSIVYPPMAGVVFTLASIPLIGWELAYLIDIIGSTIGTSISFFLGKKYGYSLLNKLVGENIGSKISKIRLKNKNQIEAAVFLRFAAGGLLSDGLAWGASLIGFRYFSFMIGFLISHLVISLPIFYFIGISISFNSWILVLFTVVLAYGVIYKFKGRYFE